MSQNRKARTYNDLLSFVLTRYVIWAKNSFIRISLQTYLCAITMFLDIQLDVTRELL